MIKITLKEARNLKLKQAYTDDRYGGIERWDFDWEQDCCFVHGDVQDEYVTIREAFRHRSFFLSLRHAVEHFYPETS